MATLRRSWVAGGLLAVLLGVAAAGEDRLPGVWLARDATGEVRLTLRSDRTYVWFVRTPQGENAVRGTWRVDGATLVATPQGEPAVRVRFAMPSEDTLEITDEDGTGLRLVRVKDAAEPALPGVAPAAPAPAPPPGARAPTAADVPLTFVQRRVLDPGGLTDPRNGATLEVLRLWIPSGWTMEGGIRWKLEGKDPRLVTRSDLASPAVIAFRIVAPDRSAWIEVFPEDRFTDTSRMPAASMFPPGSEYMGTTACPPLPPQAYVEQVLLRRFRAPVTGAQVVDAKESEALARLFREEAQRLNALVGLTGVTTTVRAGATTVNYRWNGAPWREQFFTALTYFDMPGLTLWWPRVAWSVAARADRLEALTPSLLACVYSIRFQPLWTLLYLKLLHENARGLALTDDILARIDGEIAANRAATTAQINADFQPLLMAYATAKGPDGAEAYVPSGSPVFFNPERNEYSLDPGMEGQPGWTKGK